MKQVSGSLKIELANYHELQAFAQFGSDLDDSTKTILHHGGILMEVLKQPQYVNYSVEKQIIDLFAAKHRYLENLELSEVRICLDKLFLFIKSNHNELIEEIVQGKCLELIDIIREKKEIPQNFFFEIEEVKEAIKYIS